MERLTIIPQVEDPLIEFVVHGDLSIKGGEELEVSLKTGSPEETTLEDTGEVIRLECPDDCKVYVPRAARLRLVELHGDGIIKAVDGELEVKQAHGTLELRSVGPTSIDEIHGNLEGKNILGNLEVRFVEGNLVIRDVQGDIRAEQVKGNLVLDDVDGSVYALAEGNASLRLDPAPGGEYSIEAHGNLTCSLAGDTSAVLEIKQAGRITINLPDSQQDFRNVEAPFQLTLGDGDAQMSFTAHGNVTINSQAPDWSAMPNISIGAEAGQAAEAFADQITRQIEAQMQMLEQQLNSQLDNLSVNLGTAGLSGDQIERVQRKAREATERASARAQEKLGRAQERLEHKLAQVQRNAERHARAAEARSRAAVERSERIEQRRSWRNVWAHPPHAPHPPQPPQEPVGEEERLMILRMLQEKKISLQEAETLLAALEGKDSE